MKGQKRKSIQESGRQPVMAGAFVLGTACGTAACLYVPKLAELLRHGAEQSVIQAAGMDLMLLALVLLSAFFRLGGLSVLLALAAKGFLLSAEVLQSLEQPTESLRMLAALFPSGFLTLTALILPGRQAMDWAALRYHMPPGRPGSLRPDSAYAVTAAAALLLVLLAAAVRSRLSGF